MGESCQDSVLPLCHLDPSRKGNSEGPLESIMCVSYKWGWGEGGRLGPGCTPTHDAETSKGEVPVGSSAPNNGSGLEPSSKPFFFPKKIGKSLSLKSPDQRPQSSKALSSLALSLSPSCLSLGEVTCKPVKQKETGKQRGGEAGSRVPSSPLLPCSHPTAWEGRSSSYK